MSAAPKHNDYRRYNAAYCVTVPHASVWDRQAPILFLAILLPVRCLIRILPTTPNVMHWCKCLLWIPVRKTLRTHNVLIKIPFMGHKRREGIALVNPTPIQMLQAPSCIASGRYLVRPWHAAQIPSMLRFTSIVVFRAFIGSS